MNPREVTIARPDAPVATPLHWEELEDEATQPRGWTLASVPERLGREGDPWQAMARATRSLGRARQLLAQSLAEAAAPASSTSR